MPVKLSVFTGPAGVHSDGLHRAGPDLERSCQPRAAALPGAAVLTRGIRDRQDVGAADPAFAHYVGSRIDPVRRASRSGGRRVVQPESVDRLGPLRRLLDLDTGYFATGAGAFGVGEVEDRGGRAVAGDLFRGCRIR